MRHCLTRACHRGLSFDRSYSSMAFVSGVLLHDRMMAVIEQWHGRHTQQWLLGLPLLTISLRGTAGSQSNSQKVSVSPSFKGLVCCSAGTGNVVADCAGLGVLSSTSELPHASKISGMSCADTVVSVQEQRDVDMATNKRSCVKHPKNLDW